MCIGVAAAAIYLSGHIVPIYVPPPDNLMHRFVSTCFVAPVMEEALYRFVVCVPLVALLREWPTIAISSVLFGALHVV